MLADNLGVEEEALFSMGGYNKLIGIGHEAMEICDSINNPWGKSYHRLLVGLAHFERGEPQLAIQMATEAVELGDEGGLIISSIAGRCDLAWFYGSCGAIDKALGLIEPAIKLAEANVREWTVLPISIKVRVNLLAGDVRAAMEAAAAVALKPSSIPLAHYALMVRQAEIDVAFAREDYAEALACAETVLAEMDGVVYGEIPLISARKGDALLRLGQTQEALQTLTQAAVMAAKHKSRNALWLILSSLAGAKAKLGKEKEAADNRAEARLIVEEIGERLGPLGLRESFLSQPRVKVLYAA
jgi:tetratricopeptide (TPR) repeat protein